MVKRVACFVAVFFVCVMAFAAELGGKWSADWETPAGTETVIYDFHIDGNTLTGTATSDTFGTVKLTEGKVEGDTISFVESANMMGNEIRIAYKGHLEGEQIKMTRTVADFGSFNSIAKRAK